MLVSIHKTGRKLMLFCIIFHPLQQTEVGLYKAWVYFEQASWDFNYLRLHFTITFQHSSATCPSYAFTWAYFIATSQVTHNIVGFSGVAHAQPTIVNVGFGICTHLSGFSVFRGGGGGKVWHCDKE